MYSSIDDIRGEMDEETLIQLTSDGDQTGRVNNVAGYNIGASTILYDGMDVPVAGAVVYFANHNQIYTVSAPTATQFVVTPALISALVDNETIYVKYEIDTKIVNDAILKADAEIDSALRVRFPVPLASVDPLIRTISAQLAKIKLYQRRNIMNEDLRAMKSDLDRRLREISSGQRTISVETSSVSMFVDNGDSLADDEFGDSMMARFL